MPHEIRTLVRKVDLPSEERWREAIEAQGFALELVETIDWDESPGFVVADFAGATTSFDFGFRTIGEGDPLAPGKDFEISSLLGDNPLESAAALVTHGTLQLASNGVGIDDDDPNKPLSIESRLERCQRAYVVAAILLTLLNADEGRSIPLANPRLFPWESALSREQVISRLVDSGILIRSGERLSFTPGTAEQIRAGITPACEDCD